MTTMTFIFKFYDSLVKGKLRARLVELEKLLLQQAQ